MRVSRVIQRLCVLALAVLLGPRWAETSPAPWVPAYASFVAYFDWSALSASPVLRGMESALIESKSSAQLEEFRELTGMDPLRDVWSVAYFTSSGEGVGARWGVSCYGAFDPERVIESLEAHGRVRRSEYREIPLYTVPSLFPQLGSSEGEQVLAFPDSTTALIGPAEQIRDMLDAGLGFAPLASDQGELADALKQITTGETLWIVGTGFPSRASGAPAGLGGFPPLESFSVSARVGSHVRVRVRAVTTDAEASGKLSDFVHGMAVMGALQKQSDESLRRLFESLEVETLDELVDISFEVDADMVRKYLHMEAD